MSDGACHDSDVTTERKRLGELWIVYWIVLSATICFNLYLAREESLTIDARDRMEQLRDQQSQQLLKLTELVSEVRSIASAQSKEVRELKQLFRPVQSRDQFLVAQGDRIVWSLVRFTPRGARTLCFYVPKGTHRLVYSVNQLLGENSYARSSAIKGSDHRRLQESGSIELNGETVYELRVAIEPEQGRKVSVSLLGDQNVLVHDATYPLQHPARVSLSNWQNDSDKFIAYPGELLSAGDAKAHVSAGKSDPVTGMMTLTIDDLGGRGEDSQGRVVMRFWIDSNSGGCMADTEVVARYKFLANMKQPFRPAKQEDFEQTFKPYDGSRRYYFREGYFPRVLRLE